MLSPRRLISIIALSFMFVNQVGAEPPSPHWPSFRGPNGSGTAVGQSTLMQWSVPDHKNILWKTPIAGLGHSSPVIWGDKIFITTAISGKKNPKLRVGLYGEITPVEDDTVHRWVIYCLNKTTGKALWKHTAHQAVPRIKRHTKATHANSTPVTNGQYLVTMLGSEGLFCYDMKGKLIWKRDLGLLDSGYYRAPRAQWGFASSPLIHENMVIVQCDIQKGSFLGAFNLADGKPLWRTPRNEVPTWSTPMIYTHDKKTQVVVNGYRHIGGYEIKTGKPIWWLKGGGDIPVPTPIAGHDLFYITNAHGRSAPMYAIHPNAIGDITTQAGKKNPHLAWETSRSGAYMQTPLVYGDYLYTCRDSGVLICYEAKTGKVMYKQRIGKGQSGFTASAVASNDKLYYTSELGDVFVLHAGPKFEVLAVNSLDEITMATPAISQGVLYFRTQGHLIAIGD